MYGSMMDNESKCDEMPLTENNDIKIPIENDFNFDPKAFLKNPFGERFDADFWLAVTEKYGDGKEVLWSDALNEVRIKLIKEKYVLEKKDPLVALIIEVYDKFEKYASDPDIMASFKQQLAEFARRLLSEENSEHYERPIDIPGHGYKSILHLCAERDLYHIATVYVGIYPKTVYVTTDKDRLPIELALTNRHDATASFLANKMLHQRVRGLFLGDECFDARFKFCDIIQDPRMTMTVIAILESCVNADWPFVPIPDGEKDEEAWSRMPDISLRYHFYYRLLDGDQSAEPAKINDEEENTNFNHRQPSCLQLLASSPHCQAAMYHPVVRKLVDRKWQNFGRTKIRFQCLWYIIYLAFLSCAFFTHEDKTSNSVKIFRNTCEVISLVFVFGYLVNEIDEMEKERLAYWTSPYNYLDLLGLLLVFILLPLRFTTHTYAEHGVGAAAYLINCLRVFKYFPAFKTIGIYSKTFAHIIYYDITKFALIYGIVFLAFGGAVFMSLLATEAHTTLSLRMIFLKEFRALAEGNPFNDDYDSFNDGVTFLIMINMLVIIVILSNILIGQLSYRYELAINEAGIQYSIDKTKFICRLENNRFRFLNNRIKYYVDGDYVSEENRVRGLLADWDAKKAELKALKELKSS